MSASLEPDVFFVVRPYSRTTGQIHDARGREIYDRTRHQCVTSATPHHRHTNFVVTRTSQNKQRTEYTFLATIPIHPARKHTHAAARSLLRQYVIISSKLGKPSLTNQQNLLGRTS